MNLIYSYATSQQLRDRRIDDKSEDGLHSSHDSLDGSMDGKTDVGHNSNDGNTSPQKKRKRVNLSKEQVEVLENYFHKHEYLTQETKIEIAQKLNMDQHKVVKWFDNRRSKKRNFQSKSQTSGPYSQQDLSGHVVSTVHQLLAPTSQLVLGSGVSDQEVVSVGNINATHAEITAQHQLQQLHELQQHEQHLHTEQ